MPAQPASQVHVIRLLRNLVWYNLDNGILHSAIFAAERLLAQDSSNAESAHLLALCYFRNHQVKSAKAIASKFLRFLGCAYIYAQCCLMLGNGHEKSALNALEKCKAQWFGHASWEKHTDTERNGLPDAAAVYQLMAKLYESQNDCRKAAEHYSYAVKFNPFMWESFERLCELGATVKAKAVFRRTADMQSSKLGIGGPLAVNINQRTASENLPDPFSVTPQQSGTGRERFELGNTANNPYSLSRLNEGAGNHETPSGYHLRNDSSSNEHLLRAPARKTRAAATETSRRGLGSKATKDLNHDTTKRSAAEVPAPARRSTRLLNTSKITSKFASGTGVSDRTAANATKERETKKLKSSSSTRTRTAAAATDSSKTAPSTSDTGSSVDVQMTDAKPLNNSKNGDAESEAAVQFLLDLFQKLGSGFANLSSFRCAEALQDFSMLPPCHRDTAWVMAKVGKAYYEMANYMEAEKAFSKARKCDSSRTEDMEVYSTLLWHLRKEVDLSHLAREMSDLDRLSPQTWCAIGNSFSLQREHDYALKCFKRATQLDPKFAYAYTLQGHEHVANEEYEKALCSYRTAMSVESRHYNAWYGLGKVYDKLGKFELAERHFRTAAQINPANSVLVCCIGTTLEQLGDIHGALEQYNRACTLAPSSILSRFKKAKILMDLQNYRSALVELLTLKDLAPDESKIHFALGNIYKRLRDKANAIKHFTIALNLDPKAGHLIKEAIETLEDEEELSDA